MQQKCCSFVVLFLYVVVESPGEGLSIIHKRQKEKEDGEVYNGIGCGNDQ